VLVDRSAVPSFTVSQKRSQCQSLVYKPSHAKANSGVFVRIDDGVLQTVGVKPSRAEKQGRKFSKPMLQKIREASENQQGRGTRCITVTSANL